MNLIKKHFLLNLFLVIASVTIAICLLELVLRFTSYRALLPQVGMPQYYYQADRELGFDITPNFKNGIHAFAEMPYPIWSNEFGCFDTPYQGENPYIYIAGDSFAWGFAPFAEKWGTKLEAYLGIRTLKCGVSGSGTKQEMIKAEHTLAKIPMSPKLTILEYFGGNDPEDDYSFPNKIVYNGYLIKKLEDRTLDYDAAQKVLPRIAEWSEKYCMITRPAHPALQRVKCFLTKNSISYHLFKNGIKQFISGDVLRNVGAVNAPVPDAPIQQGDYQEHLSNVLAFSKFATTKNSDFLVVLVPLDGDVSAEDIKVDPYAELKTFLTAHHIAYVDLLSVFRSVSRVTGKTLYWQHDPHWNIAGNHLVGLLVSQVVLERSPWISDREKKLAAVRKALLDEFSVAK